MISPSHLILFLQAEMMAKMQAQQAAFLAQYGDLDSEEEEGENGGEEKERLQEEVVDSPVAAEINSLGDAMTSTPEEINFGGIEAASAAAAVLGTTPASSSRRQTSPASGPTAGVRISPPGVGGEPPSSRGMKGSPLPPARPSWEVRLGRVEACEGECAVCREGGGSGRAGVDDEEDDGMALKGVLGWVAHVSVCPVLMATSSSLVTTEAGCHRGRQEDEAGRSTVGDGGGGGGGGLSSSRLTPGGPSAVPVGAMDEAPGLHVLCCGHKMHATCYARHR